MPKKRLIIHPGVPKTGSSALQTYFSANIAALAALGIDYPYAEPQGSVIVGNCSGNIVQILFRDGYMEAHRLAMATSGPSPGLVLDAFRDDIIDRILDLTSASSLPTVLFSGEVLASMAAAGWQRLAAARDRFDVHVVAFVRDPYDFMLSAWCQHVKTQKIKPELDFAAYVGLPAERALRNTGKRRPTASAFLAPGRIAGSGLPFTLLNFDTCRTDIVGAFFAAARLDRPQGNVQELDGERYNRSLTYSEALLLQRIRRTLGNDDFAALVRTMLLERERPKRRSHYSRSVDAAMLALLAPYLEEINGLISGPPLRTELRDEAETPDEIHPDDVEVLLAALRRVSDTADTEIWRPNFSGGKPAEIVPPSPAITPDGLPADFNTDAYYMHNPDVAAAGMDAADHYLRYGKAEGRRYRFA